jgi:hypothetical protein
MIAKNVSIVCFGLRVVRRVTGLEIVRTLYYAYFQSLLSQGTDILWQLRKCKIDFQITKESYKSYEPGPKNNQLQTNLQIITYITSSILVHI